MATTPLRLALAGFGSVDDAPRKVRRRELPAVAESLATAFADDPVLTWCVPDTICRDRVLPLYFQLIVDTLWLYDEIFTVGDDAGAAVWAPEGEPTIPCHLESGFDTRLAELLGPDAERFGQVLGLLERSHPPEPSAYLWYLGIRPEAQRCGFASALLTAALRRCDAEKTPAYAEATTPAGRALFVRHGFEQRSELTLPGGPSIATMWRAAAR